jgi:hypothetical protein
MVISSQTSHDQVANPRFDATRTGGPPPHHAGGSTATLGYSEDNCKFLSYHQSSVAGLKTGDPQKHS